MKKENKRSLIQLIAAVFSNGYLLGYLKGKIYTGKTKIICVPGLNCYSCPGALGSCPIGAMQSVASGRGHRISFYVLGIIMLFGIFLGRIVCGFLCPFGFLQDLLYKIPGRKMKVPEKADRPMRYIKYVVLVLFVIILPGVVRDGFGLGTTWFCKYICPAGTLGAGLPLMATNEVLRNSAGMLFAFKLGILIAVVLLSVLICRPFCKYICPLGALYGIFNKYSFFRLEIDKDKCTGCKKCERVCPMNIRVTEDISNAECISCGKCASECPEDAVRRMSIKKKSRLL